jgi:hypothetical protein
MTPCFALICGLEAGDDLRVRGITRRLATALRSLARSSGLANGGNAVNFLHGTSVGPFIHLVQAEILAGIRLLASGELRLSDIPSKLRDPTEDRGDLGIEITTGNGHNGRDHGEFDT